MKNKSNIYKWVYNSNTPNAYLNNSTFQKKGNQLYKLTGKYKTSIT